MTSKWPRFKLSDFCSEPTPTDHAALLLVQEIARAGMSNPFAEVVTLFQNRGTKPPKWLRDAASDPAAVCPGNKPSPR